MKDNETNEPKGEVVSIKAPRLDPVEKLYVRAFLSKLSHSYAHKVVCPHLQKGLNDNQFSRRENVQFHISQALQEKAEALDLTPGVILEKLYKEAIREDRTASHNARIQALSLLGKHFGLFEEKKEVEQFTFNIINYGSDKDTKVEVGQPEVSEDSSESISSDFTLTDYSKE